LEKWTVGRINNEKSADFQPFDLGVYSPSLNPAARFDLVAGGCVRGYVLFGPARSQDGGSGVAAIGPAQIGVVDRRPAVQISVTLRHVSVPEEVKTYAQEKASKLPRFYDRVQAIEVTLDHEGDNFTVDMIVTAEGRDNFIGHERGPDLFALIDLTVDKLERQLRRHKERFRNRKHLVKNTDKFGEGAES